MRSFAIGMRRWAGGFAILVTVTHVHVDGVASQLPRALQFTARKSLGVALRLRFGLHFTVRTEFNVFSTTAPCATVHGEWFLRGLVAKMVYM